MVRDDLGSEGDERSRRRAGAVGQPKGDLNPSDQWVLLSKAPDLLAELMKLLCEFPGLRKNGQDPGKRIEDVSEAMADLHGREAVFKGNHGRSVYGSRSLHLRLHDDPPCGIVARSAQRR